MLQQMFKIHVSCDKFCMLLVTLQPAGSSPLQASSSWHLSSFPTPDLEALAGQGLIVLNVVWCGKCPRSNDLACARQVKVVDRSSP